MAPRAYWNGHLRLSLVTFPVHLYPVVSETHKIRLHKISKKSGERIHYENTTDSEKHVDKEDIVKGYEYKKGHYVQIDDKELDALKLESTHMIDLVQFTDIKDIDAIYFDKPYFLTPADKLATEAYVTIRDALREEKKVALGQIVLANKERIVAIRPCGKGMILETLRYANEIRKAEGYFDDIKKDVKVSKDQIDLARQLIASKDAPFDPHDFKDKYQQSLMEIVEAKMKGKKIEPPKETKRNDNVVDIMSALRKSLEKGGDVGKAKTSAKKKTAHKSTKKKKAA